jgi:hypothetical protein
MRRIVFVVLCSFLLALPARAATPFQENNPDVDKFAFAKSYIASLSYYGRLDKRLAQEAAFGDKYDRDLPTIKVLIDDRTLDNTELRVARNYLGKYAASKNMLIRKVAYDAMTAYEQHIFLSSREKRLWEAYYKFKKLAMPGGLNEAEFKKQMESLARDRKGAALGVLRTVLLFKTVLLSAARCQDETCHDLALTQSQRDKLVKKLDAFAPENTEWGMKPGQATFEAAVASVREVLEDPVYVPIP